MGKLVAVLLGLVLGSAAFGVGHDEKSITLYVSTDGNDEWSGRLEAPNSEKTDGPFASMQCARNAIRALRKTQTGLDRPVNVLVRDGTYFLSKTLTFAPEDSGKKSCPITYQAYPGETPVISGGRRIAGWKKSKGQLWTLDIPDVRDGKWYFRELFGDGTRRQRARTPNKGFYQVAGAVSEAPKTSFIFADGDVKQWKHLHDVEVIVYHRWDESRLRIQDVDEEQKTVRFTGPAVYPFLRWPPQPYYVENLPEGLDTPGEWYLDRDSGKLTYWPMENEDPSEGEWIAPVLEQLVVVAGGFGSDGRCTEYVHDLTFRGLTFAHAEFPVPEEGYRGGWGDSHCGFAIELSGVNRCSIKNCRIRNIGNNAINLKSFCKYTRIVGNEIAYPGAGGITVNGAVLYKGDKSTDQTRFNTIWGNHVHHCGELFQSAIGISVAKSSDNFIAHNHVHDITYLGISIGSSSSHDKPLDARCKRNIIAFNDIHDVMTDLSDGGCIYTYGRCPGTRIAFNRLRNSYGLAEDSNAYGIHLDEPSLDLIVEKNIVTGTRMGAIQLHIASHNIIRNNIFAHGTDFQLSASRAKDNIFEQNIVYGESGELFRDRWTENTAVMDKNVYFLAHEKPVFPGNLSFSEWKETGQDTHSLVADPLFVDPGKDFSLRPDSPALSIGFEPFTHALENVPSEEARVLRGKGLNKNIVIREAKVDERHILYIRNPFRFPLPARLKFPKHTDIFDLLSNRVQPVQWSNLSLRLQPFELRVLSSSHRPVSATTKLPKEQRNFVRARIKTLESILALPGTTLRDLVEKWEIRRGYPEFHKDLQELTEALKSGDCAGRLAPYDDIEMGEFLRRAEEYRSTSRPEPTSVYRVNCGSDSAYRDKQGNKWEPDQSYIVELRGFGHISEKPGAASRGEITVQGTEDETLYRTERYGLNAYAFLVPNGTYTVRLHFAETWKAEPGARIFSVNIEDKCVIEDLDISVEAGFRTALVKTVSHVRVEDGQLDITFLPRSGSPAINAIEVIEETVKE